MAKYRVNEWNHRTFPALYRCANEASLNAQWWYLFWVRVNLILLVAGALAGSLRLSAISDARLTHGASAACFVLALATTILLAFRRWESVWYAGRAIAESVKSLTWKFITGADPFPVTLCAEEAVKLFTGFLLELLQEKKHLAIALAGRHTAGEQVTEDMAKLRATAVGYVRDVYLQQRVNEQQGWYAKKANDNKRARNIWFVLLITFQAAAVIAAVLLTVEPAFPWVATGLFSTLASATVAWGQVKRFQELAQAYALTTQELSLISARGPYVDNREKLARFVNDAETAISREHSTWVARRETK